MFSGRTTTTPTNTLSWNVPWTGQPVERLVRTWLWLRHSGMDSISVQLGTAHGRGVCENENRGCYGVRDGDPAMMPSGRNERSSLSFPVAYNDGQGAWICNQQRREAWSKCPPRGRVQCGRVYTYGRKQRREQAVQRMGGVCQRKGGGRT